MNLWMTGATGSRQRQELGYDVSVQNVSKPCMENANSDFERQSEQSRISQPDYSAEQDAQANNILSERENYLNPDQPYNYVDSDGYEQAKVLGGAETIMKASRLKPKRIIMKAV